MLLLCFLYLSLKFVILVSDIAKLLGRHALDIAIGLIIANAEDITVRTIRQDFALSIATLLTVGADSLYSKRQINKNLEEYVTLYSF